MPRNVRNFWLHADIDGRSPLKGGPQAKDGCMDVTLKVREDGGIRDAVSILCRAEDDGTLRVIVQDGSGRELGRMESAR